MTHENRLRTLERQLNYQAWVATTEFFKGRSSAELLFFAVFGWFLNDDPHIPPDKRLLEFRFPNYLMTLELVESTGDKNDHAA